MKSVEEYNKKLKELTEFADILFGDFIEEAGGEGCMGKLISVMSEKDRLETKKVISSIIVNLDNSVIEIKRLISISESSKWSNIKNFINHA